MASHIGIMRIGAIVGAAALVGAISACTPGAGGDADSGAATTDCVYNYSIGSDSTDRLPYRELSSLGEYSPESGVRVGVVLKTLSNQYWSEVQRGAEAAGKLFGAEVTVQAATDESSQSEQLTVAQTVANQSYDAYVISPQDDSNLTPMIRDVESQCAPLVVVIEPGVVGSTYIGADEIAVGAQQAGFLASALPAGSEVLVIEGQAGSKAGENRVTGFTEEATAKGLVVAGSGVGNWDQSQALNATQQLLQRFPDVKGIYAANDTMALGVAQAVEASGLDIIVTGTDAVPAAIELVRDGSMGATNTPFPYYQGCKAVETALRTLAGQEVPAWVDSAPTLVTQDNVEALFDAEGNAVDTGSCEPPAE